MVQAVAVEGMKWSLVAQHVPSRSDVQCRERYMNVLHPSLKPDPWDTGTADRMCSHFDYLVFIAAAEKHVTLRCLSLWPMWPRGVGLFNC